MIIIAAAVLGILLGVLSARRNKGNMLDQLQYGAGFGIAFALVGVIVTIVLSRMVG
jgi:hypothetical protein